MLKYLSETTGIAVENRYIWLSKMIGSINAWWLGKKSTVELVCKSSDPLIEILYLKRSNTLILKAKIFDKITMNELAFFIRISLFGLILSKIIYNW
jgi:hypothetical protein